MGVNKTANLRKQKAKAKKSATRCLLPVFCYLLFALCYLSCTFDYGERDPSEDEQPDLIMTNVEYVRVRSSDILARFQADRAERYERQGIMKVENFIFEQYAERGDEINAIGRAGYASVNIETGDIFMELGVRIEVDAEDIIIETNQLEWKDEDRVLSTREDEDVNIFQDNGTSFTGIGLYVDARRRSWEFMGNVGGIFIHEDAEEEITEAEDDEHSLWQIDTTDSLSEDDTI